MRAKTVVAGVALAVAAFGAASTRTSADRGGNPDAEACAGQVIAALAQAGSGGEGTGKVSMQDFHFGFIRQACAAGESVAAIVQKVREAAGEQ